MESPHMDPAVVVAHPMAPPPNSSYRHSQFNSVAATTTSQVISENEAPCIPTTIVVPLQTIPVPSPGNPALTLSQAALNHPPQDYDPNQPIPTQTFTNQNFVAMQNIMTVVSPYVPVTVPAQHFTPDNILQQQSTNIITSVETPAVEHADTGDNNEISEKNNGTDDKETEEATGNGENRVADQEQESANQSESQTNYTSHAQNNHQSRSFSNRGSRGGRGRSFNYLRGRSYGNGRGYYQGSYGGRDSSGSSSGYNGYRRPPRGGIRGGMRGGNNRGGGRGGYRPQQ
ncbi:interleukin enhancer-binding factor 3 homolog isoform X1 [Centruroides sculpturatus]|uniref:interleukin enhancer-binding factor 3 homolog isoform X1 n=1 Tax=Centruroides sculpturatus TaxID=218467 RepID=UPI000C6CAC50|nr:interleukin enhancer-binding factor 3 homolog isoform X1 [Centruroides sculpturatus]